MPALCIAMVALGLCAPIQKNASLEANGSDAAEIELNDGKNEAELVAELVLPGVLPPEGLLGEGLNRLALGQKRPTDSNEATHYFLQKQIDQNTANLNLRLLELKDRVEELEDSTSIAAQLTPSYVLSMEDRIEIKYVDSLLEKKLKQREASENKLVLELKDRVEGLEKKNGENVADLAKLRGQIKDVHEHVYELEERFDAQSAPGERKLLLEMEDRMEWFVDFLLEKKIKQNAGNLDERLQEMENRIKGSYVSDTDYLNFPFLEKITELINKLETSNMLNKRLMERNNQLGAQLSLMD